MKCRSKTCSKATSHLIRAELVQRRVLLYLESLDLDELLDPVDDEQVSALVVVGNVAGMEPLVLDGLGCGLLVVQVAQHHLERVESRAGVNSMNGLQACIYKSF